MPLGVVLVLTAGLERAIPYVGAKLRKAAKKKAETGAEAGP